MLKPSFIALFMSFLIFCSCKNEVKKEGDVIDEEPQKEYAIFGKEIIPDDAINASSMVAHYNIMAIGDSIPAKIKATVIDVCQAKGCWMTLDLDDDMEVMVKFKDYVFFVPKDISGKEVIINGNAYVSEVSVDEQRHYAEDAGESEEKINSITKPKKTYLFEADGVLVAH